MHNALVLEKSIYPVGAARPRKLDEELELNFMAESTPSPESRAEAPATRHILFSAFTYGMTFVLGLAWASAFPVRTKTVEVTQVVKQCPDGMTCLKSVVVDDSVRQMMLTAKAMAGIREP